MKPGYKRFQRYLTEIRPLLEKVARQKNPALWLYKNNLRTPLFMLEGLAKMHISFHNPNKFTRIKMQVKLLEDTLGAIDYYDNFAKELQQNKKIPKSIIAYLQAQTREKIQSLNEQLLEKGWLNFEHGRIQKIEKKLSKADWLDSAKEIKSIHAFYTHAIGEIITFADRSDFHFKNVESEVHELRRKLRWLSIYPQALGGAIQLKDNKKTPPHLKKYLTPLVKQSPFNQLPPVGDNKHTLELEKNYFYSLSWMIDALGKLKDNGLRVIIVKEALQQTSSVSDTEAYKKTYALLGKKQLTIREVLDEADKLVKTYIREKNLNRLLA